MGFQVDTRFGFFLVVTGDTVLLEQGRICFPKSTGSSAELTDVERVHANATAVQRDRYIRRGPLRWEGN